MKRESIPVCLLTGYLGAGKTTLMNHILNQEHGYRVAVIVNDVGEVNIDARLIQEGGNIQKEDSDSIISLANGCVCCTLKADLIEQLKQLADSGRFDYILIEASGASDPIPLAQTIVMMDEALGRTTETELVHLDNIVTVADAYRFAEEFGCGDAIVNKEDVEEEDIEALLINQLEFCNIVLLNKVDLVSEEALEHIRSVIKALNTAAKIIETTNAEVDLKEILGTGNFDFEEAAGSAGWIKALEQDPIEEEAEHHHEHGECGCGGHGHHHEHGECGCGGHGHHHEHGECGCGGHNHHEHGEGCGCGSHHHHEHKVKYGIETFVYYRRRPFKQEKFAEVVQSWRNNVIRSKGFLWFVEEPERAYIYEQAGKQITLEDDGMWVAAEDAQIRKEIIAENPELLQEWDDEYGDRVIRLAIIGQNLDKKKMVAELDAALGE